METDKKPTITQAGLRILERLIGKKVNVRGPHGESVVEPGPTIITGANIRPDRIGGGKGLQHPDSDGKPR